MTRVLVVDDSPFMRAHIADILTDEGLTVVGQASDGREAIDMVAEEDPDVVTMDIKMPGIGGLEAVRRIMDRHPTPILMLSGYVEEGTNLLFEALNAGAVDFFPKPGGQVSPDLIQYSDLLAETVRVVADVEVAGPDEIEDRPTPSVDRSGDVSDPTLVIGASTGGPSVVEDVVANLPREANLRILVVVHMPEMFTERYANRLERASAYDFAEATDGGFVDAGEGVVARGGKHLECVAETGEGLETRLTTEPKRHNVRPAADVTMETVAGIVDGPLVGLVLTGMGKDGADGLAAIESAGGYTIVQDRASCAVDGMPSHAASLVAVDDELPIEDIPQAIVDAIDNDAGTW